MKERDARGRHAREEGAPALEAHENRFYSLSEGAEDSYWLRGSQRDKCSREEKQLSIEENTRSFVHM